MACDINSDIRRIYNVNYGIEVDGDIHQLNLESIPSFHILCAGFPCQPFSIAGKGEGFSHDTQGNLFDKIMEIVDLRRPQTLILENVKNLYTIHNGSTFRYIIDALHSRQYKISYRVLDSKYYGSPQSRKRIYIVCDLWKDYIFRELHNQVVPVSSCLDLTVTNYFNYKPKYSLEACPAPTNGMISHRLINVETGKGGRQGERVYRIDTCGPTICANSGGPGSNTGLYMIDGKIRRLSVGETLQMFGFSVDYQTAGVGEKKMLCFLGNSIVTNVLDVILEEVSEQLY
jgi:DNA (cytosine-5)-methyltransferase 1